MKKKPTVEELERILEHEGDESVQILPNGELRVKEQSKWKKGFKIAGIVLTILAGLFFLFYLVVRSILPNVSGG